MSSLHGEFARFSAMGAGALNGFPDPFYDVASLAVPANMRTALYWAEHIFSVNGTYRMAMERVIAYFLTEIEVQGGTDDETEQWKDLHGDVLNTLGTIQSLLRDRACYGNGYASVITPFQRFLSCPKCGFRVLLREAAENPGVFEYSFKIPEYSMKCPQCAVGRGYKGVVNCVDEPDKSHDKLKIKLWNPHQIELVHCTWTEDIKYVWRIPEDYKRQIRQGYLFQLERCPADVIDAIARNQLYVFEPGAVYHMKEPTLSGIVNRGVGIPRIFTNFRQLFHVQVLRRFTEAIALDYVIPYRIITPAPAQGRTGSGMGTDALLMYSGHDFKTQVEAMNRRRRRDPAGMNVLPFPVNYQMLGAEANQIAPRDLHDQAMETLLNESGTPVELYNGSLQIQTAPVALRLFQSTWHHLWHDANAFLRWLANQVNEITSWKEVKSRLKPPTLADDIEKQMLMAQLAVSQMVSGTTMLAGLGRDWREEQRRLADEATYQAKLQARTSEELQQAGFAGQMARGLVGTQPPGQQGQLPPPQGQGGAPSGGGQPQDPNAQPQGPVSQYLASTGPNTPQTPNDIDAVASSMATDLMGMPDSAKNAELRKLKTANKPLADLVKVRMDEQREQARKASKGPSAG